MRDNAPVQKKQVNILVIILNVLLLAGVFWCYTQYSKAYQEQLWDENIGNVANLNDAAIINSTSLFDSWNIKLLDIKQYVGEHSLTLEQTLDYIAGSNSQGSRYFQLVGSDYLGYLATRDAQSGEYIKLDYSSYSYQSALQPVIDNSSEAFEGIRFAPEFTDAGTTGTRFFAVYQYIALSGEERPWTLFLAMRSKSVMDALNAQPGFPGQATVLINAKGDFIVNNKYFSSTNLFEYIRERNDLSLDQLNALKSEVQASDSGELYYKKLNGTALEDTVFRYEKMTGLGSSDWYCVTCVPISSFKTPQFKFGYIIGIIALLLVMVLVDSLWFSAMNRRLRESMIREREASLAKGNFLSRMSHEIRTPLNAIIGYNTIARDKMATAQTDNEHRQAEVEAFGCLEKSDIASKHLLTIINDVLDMSAVESGKIQIAHEKFDFKGLITSLTTVFYSQAQSKGIAFEVVFHTLVQEWFVGDEMRTNQILTNLLSNAVKFTSGGGKVTLAIGQSNDDSGATHIHFTISDTGIGMTEEYLSRIWTPFEQADSSISRRFGGTGLGLTITKNLVDLMDGSITVNSKPDAGTAFDLDLAFETMEAEQPEKNHDFKDVSVLVVEDESACDYTMLLFEGCDVRCVAAHSAEAALKAFQASLAGEKPFTLCLIDLKMSHREASDTIRCILDSAGNAKPAIALLVYDYAEIPDHIKQMQVDRIVSKPLFRSTVLDMLAHINGTQSPQEAQGDKKPRFDGARVLLVEDNTMNMEIACRQLEFAGLVVEKAWNGREAVEQFTGSEPGTFQAILMDIHMPELDGLTATRVIRASGHPDAKAIPIIAVSADAFAENIAEALDAGMNAQVSKPIDMSALFEMLEKYIT